MEKLSDVDIEFLAWKQVLAGLDEKRRERLKALLKDQMSRPPTLGRRAARWERALAAGDSETPATHIAALEACLEEAISVVREVARERSSPANHRSV